MMADGASRTDGDWVWLQRRQTYHSEDGGEAEVGLVVW